MEIVGYCLIVCLVYVLCTRIQKSAEKNKRIQEAAMRSKKYSKENDEKRKHSTELISIKQRTVWGKSLPSRLSSMRRKEISRSENDVIDKLIRNSRFNDSEIIEVWSDTD